jgi:hypothetical protein
LLVPLQHRVELIRGDRPLGLFVAAVGAVKAVYCGNELEE